MTLLISVFAAVIVTILWYTNQNARELKVGLLCYMFWGASLMWMVDAIAEYVELKAAYFTPALEDMINDTPGLELEYYKIVDGNTLQEIEEWDDSDYVVGCIALFCGKIRLIDNIKYKEGN